MSGAVLPLLFANVLELIREEEMHLCDSYIF